MGKRTHLTLSDRDRHGRNGTSCATAAALGPFRAGCQLSRRWGSLPILVLVPEWQAVFTVNQATRELESTIVIDSQVSPWPDGCARKISAVAAARSEQGAKGGM
jgi:hypothetical protein